MITRTKVQLKALRKVARLAKDKHFASQIELTARDTLYIHELIDLKLLSVQALKFDPHILVYHYSLTDLGRQELAECGDD